MPVLQKLRKRIKLSKRRDYIAKRTAVRFGLNSVEFKMIMKACDESRSTHKGGKRDNGESLITHERALVAIADHVDILDVDIYVALFLHDMHEDYPDIWPLIRIERDYNRTVRNLVRAVSKPLLSDYKTRAEQDVAIFERVRHGGRSAMIIKCIDRLHNMLTMWGGHEKIARKVNQTIVYVLPISVACNTLTDELMSATLEQSRKFRLSPTSWR